MVGAWAELSSGAALVARRVAAEIAAECCSWGYRMVSAPQAAYAKGPKARAKMKTVMGEFKDHTLHSGSKHGPKVTSRAQAIAIGLSQARKTVMG